MKNIAKILTLVIFALSSALLICACGTANNVVALKVFVNDTRVDKADGVASVSLKEDLDKLNVRVYAVYGDESEAELLLSEDGGLDGGYTIDYGGYDANVPGTYMITVTFEDSHQVKFEVVVVDTSLQSLTVVEKPTDMVYDAFEKVDLTGLKVRANYADGETEIIPVSDLDVEYINGRDKFYAGETSIKLWYGGISVSLSGFSVSKVLPEGISAPQAVSAQCGTKLSDIQLPEGYSFQDSLDTVVSSVGENVFKVTYVSSDAVNHLPVQDLDFVVNGYLGTYTSVVYEYEEGNSLTGVYDASKTLASYTLADGFFWVNPNEVPVVGKTQYDAYYNDSAYYANYALKINLTLEKADPVVTSLPVILNASRVYVGQTLAEVSFVGGVANTEGTFAWADLETEITSTAKTAYLLTFTPADTENYNVITCEREFTAKQLTLSMPAEGVNVSVVRGGQTVNLKDGDNIYWHEDLAISVGVVPVGYIASSPLKVNSRAVENSSCVHTVTKDVVVTYQIEPQGIEMILLRKKPTKTTYVAGETFDVTGMSVYIAYKDGTYDQWSEKSLLELLTVTYQNGTAFSEGDTYVTLSYSYANGVAGTSSNAELKVNVTVTA